MEQIMAPGEASYYKRSELCDQFYTEVIQLKPVLIMEKLIRFINIKIFQHKQFKKANLKK